MPTSSTLNASSTQTPTNGLATAVSFPLSPAIENASSEQSLFLVLTFSAGPRGCTGKQFAYVEATVTLALIMRNFELFPVVSESGYRDREELRRELLNYTTALSTRPTMTKVVFRPYARNVSEVEDSL